MADGEVGDLSADQTEKLLQFQVCRNNDPFYRALDYRNMSSTGILKWMIRSVTDLM